MEIPLSRVYPIVAPEKYKVHFACWNGSNQPLDVFVRSRTEWESWNRWRGVHDIFNRDFIFALIDFYPERDRWLFGGSYEVLSKTGQQKAHSYVVKLLDESLPYIGRLKVILKRPGRAKVMNLENYYHKFTVSEILPHPYTGEAFCGYDSINIAFSMLESVFAIQRADWKAALENTKGVYLITDTSNGKRYVGAAYGVTGIWSRWGSYIFTGHGYTDELTKLIATHGLDYARQHFRFALLEQRTMKTDDLVIIQRERYWKDVLLTREPYGYNKN
jgi:hypothetical protein